MDREVYDKNGEKLNVEWLLADGWSINANLCLRHILWICYNDNKNFCKERVEQLFMQYDCLEYGTKMIETLQEIIAFDEELRKR